MHALYYHVTFCFGMFYYIAYIYSIFAVHSHPGGLITNKFMGHFRIQTWNMSGLVTFISLTNPAGLGYFLRGEYFINHCKDPY